MIKTILITGLDGSGKSVIFSKLKSQKLEHVTLLTLPHIDEDVLPEDSALKKHTKLLNEMGADADKNNRSDLKALSLFGAMMLYQKLADEMVTPLTRVLVCERHPLVDPLVYARFYTGRISPGSLKRERLDYYNEAYGQLLGFILSLLPVKGLADPAGTLFTFIHDCFKDATVPDEKLRALFKTSLPDEIYFLKAEPGVLLNRIASRKVSEPHEQLQILALFDKIYDSLFDAVAIRHKTVVEYIHASQFESLDRFYGRLVNEILNQ
ncbi:hypothetical protein [Xanthocytophaga agilis]|uniref:Uncharacterized protein n=1 Tax=Xanthocytophaga agilis TaxID=3048010 RepID=A0AAE3R9W5_9BACT|nr:hypothetical protein [Xanthocytophaga agilis]MDJ1505910.1 hypothetical protein [Xanthocytophaga agilis]